MHIPGGWLVVAGYGAGMACWITSLLIDELWLMVPVLVLSVMTLTAAVRWYRRSRRGPEEGLRLTLASVGVQVMLAVGWVTDGEPTPVDVVFLVLVSGLSLSVVAQLLNRARRRRTARSIAPARTSEDRD